MELINPNTNFDFVYYLKPAIAFSLVLILIGLVSLWYHGGTKLRSRFCRWYGRACQIYQPTAIADIRQALADHKYRRR